MSLRLLYHLARADFLERTRRYSFLITLGVTLYLGFVFLPSNHARYVTMQISGHRAVYTSAYVGSLLAVLTSVFLSLAGFYLVKNALDRDIQTRVGQILATTTLTRPLYTLGKALSNFAVLSALVGVMAVAAGIMQLLRHEDTVLRARELLAPFLFITLPVMALVASLAILFETMRPLRGGLGNVAYVPLWLAALMVLVVRYDALRRGQFNDVLGLGITVPSLSAACEAAFPGCTGSGFVFSAGITFKSDSKLWHIETFHWEGIHWTLETVLGRLVWVAVAGLIALIAAAFFHRFDPAQESLQRTHAAPVDLPEGEVEPIGALKTHTDLSRMEMAVQKFSLGAMVFAELRLALKGVGLWWYLVGIVLLIGETFSPLAISRFWLIGAWIWPVLIWSAMGTREARQGTGQLIFSISHPLRRQLLACWIAGVIVASVMGAGTVLRLLLAGNAVGFIDWTVGVLFIPSLALALGVWSSSSKLFEVVYMLLWYTGPVGRVGSLDYMGATGLSSRSSRLVFLTCTLALVLAASLGRRRQMRM